MLASKTKQPQSISKEEIQDLPLLSYDGGITLIKSKQAWLDVFDEISQENILGFDTETKPTYVKGPLNKPAIMQFATSKQVYVIQLSHTKLLPSMCDILENPNILKVGVALRDDMIFLQKHAKFKVEGNVELANIAKAKGYKEAGLRTLCASVFGGRLSKTMRCSNWERSTLSQAQLLYAATDAWVSRELYLKLNNEEHILSNCIFSD